MSALRGETVVVTRPSSQAHHLVSALEAAGARALELPVIEVAPATDQVAFEDALRAFARGRHEAIVFTSANAVDAVMSGLGRLALDFYRGATIVAVGPATAKRLEDGGVTPTDVPEEFMGVDAAGVLGPGDGGLLLPQAEQARPSTRAAFEDLGWRVDAVGAYRTVVGTPDPTALQQVKRGDFDAVTFASGSAVRHFVELTGDPVALGLGPGGGRSVICMGISATQAATTAGLLVTATSARNTVESLVDAVVDSLSSPSI